MELSGIPGRISDGLSKTAWLTLKRHHLFIARIPKEFLEAVPGNATGDKEDEFTEERLFRREGKNTYIGNFQRDGADGFYVDYGDG